MEALEVRDAQMRGHGGALREARAEKTARRGESEARGRAGVILVRCMLTAQLCVSQPSTLSNESIVWMATGFWSGLCVQNVVCTQWTYTIIHLSWTRGHLPRVKLQGVNLGKSGRSALQERRMSANMVHWGKLT